MLGLGVNDLKKNRERKEVTETMKRDYVTNKLLLVFTLAFVLLLAFTNIGRVMRSVDSSYKLVWDITKVATGVFAALFLCGIARIFYEKARGIDTKYRLLSGKNIALASAFFAICMLPIALTFNPKVLNILYVFVPAVVVLYIVYYSYQREFFMIALSSAIGGVGIWLVHSSLVNALDKFIVIAVGLAMVLLIAFTVVAQLGNGILRMFDREFVFFKPGTRYALVYLTYFLVLALIAAAFLAGDIAMYFVYGLIAYLVLIGIYYTVKLV